MRRLNLARRSAPGKQVPRLMPKPPRLRRTGFGGQAGLSGAADPRKKHAPRKDKSKARPLMPLLPSSLKSRGDHAPDQGEAEKKQRAANQQSARAETSDDSHEQGNQRQS